MSVALASAFVLKRLQREVPVVQTGREAGTELGFNATVYEVSLIVMAAYAAYIVAEVGLCLCGGHICRRGLSHGFHLHCLAIIV